MPTPRANETQQDFLTRCMLDTEARTDFPDTDQRLAFCYSQYESNKSVKKLNKNIVDRWRDDYDKQLSIAERKLLPKVTSAYFKEYLKGVQTYIDTGNINYQNVFNIDMFQKIYKDIYNEVCMRFAVWYFRNSEKYQEKKSPKQYTRTWQAAFSYYASQVAAQNVTLVSGTAKKSLMQVIQKLYRDPDFVILGAEERARILRSKFKQYSRHQALRLVRTESLRGASYGVEQSALQVYAGRKMKKQWVTFFDSKTREWHQNAHNQIVDFDKPFLVGGEQMMRPGEGSGMNVINCRCSMIPFPEDVESTLPFQ